MQASLPAFGAHSVDLWQVCKKPLPFGAAQLGGTYLYVLHKEVSPGGGGGTYNYAGSKITLRLSFKVLEKNTSKRSGSVVCILVYFFLNFMVQNFIFLSELPGRKLSNRSKGLSACAFSSVCFIS